MAHLRANVLGFCLLAALWGASAACADSVAVAFADPSGFNDAAQLRLLRASEEVLRERSGLTVQEQPKPVFGAPRRRCGEDFQCLRTLAAATGADYALLLSVGASAAGLALDGVWLEVNGQRALQRKVKGVDLDAPQGRLRELVEALLPAYVRRGYGGLRVDVEAGARIKVDGRAVATAPMSEPLPVLAGRHEVDVLLPRGQARLQTVTIPEGTKVPLKLESSQALIPPAAEGAGLSGIRMASYTAWTAGAVAFAGAFVAAALAQRTALQPCGPTGTCSSEGQALEAQQRARQLTDSANVLFGVGAGGITLGAGLFWMDVSSPR